MPKDGFEEQLDALMKKFGKTGVLLSVWQEGKDVKVAYTVNKMKLKNALPAIFWALTDLVQKGK